MTKETAATETCCRETLTTLAAELASPFAAERALNRTLCAQRRHNSLLREASVAAAQGRSLDAWLARLEAGNWV